MHSAPDVRAQSKQNLLFLCPTVQNLHTKETGIQTNSKFHINGDGFLYMFDTATT